MISSLRVQAGHMNLSRFTVLESNMRPRRHISQRSITSPISARDPKYANYTPFDASHYRYQGITTSLQVAEQKEPSSDGSYSVEETPYLRYVSSNWLNMRNKSGRFEKSWSGNGRHVQFPNENEERSTLVYYGNLGHGAYGSVDRVCCTSPSGSLFIVRKYVRGTRGKALETFMKEADLCAPLKHKHVIQTIGTYHTVGSPQLALLQWPVGHWTLEEFMGSMDTPQGPLRSHRPTLLKFFGCLASAIDYVHGDSKHGLKHMDIKPENIIVKQIDDRRESDEEYFTVVLSDFGLARTAAFGEQTQNTASSGTTGFTRDYAAPEVIPQYWEQSHSRRSDIFSLGCVYAEMLTVLTGAYSSGSLEAFKNYRQGKGRDGRVCAAYYCNLPYVDTWLFRMQETWDVDPEATRYVRQYDRILHLINMMLKHDPRERPSHRMLVTQLDASNCCSTRFIDCDSFWSN
ncbi:kinase-like protein [Patellaria atrata CBS 101060]|uniref:Kinase-like protein n=1 Tax=Patellaria atrata CBS 101060 TaxID=1346257 RepID=A0A9P4VT76_9PEZI|nr:kinase-like protein [Patellaria atrata CBS 101060]